MKLAVLFHRLGPYHVARLCAAAACGRGALVAVELSGSGGEYEWAPVAADGFARVTVCPAGDSNALPRRELARRVGARLDAVKPDVVAVAGWGDRGMRAAAAWGRRHRVPTVLMSDSQHRDEKRVWWKEWVKRRYVAGFAAGFVAGTPHADYLTTLGMPRERVFLGYDVVDNDHFAHGADVARADARRLRAELGLPPRFFLTCARFVAKKNLATLLDAYAAYRTAAADPWHLVLVGDGELRPGLEARAARLGIEATLHLPGFKQYGELAAYYGLASAFVLPSVQDQWGLVVNEALAAGLAVLASDACGCVPDLLGEGEGFDPHNAAGLARRMLELARQPADIVEQRARVAAWGLDRFAGGLWNAAENAGKRNVSAET